MSSATRNLFSPEVRELIPFEDHEGLTHKERARLFHEANPHVYEAIASIAKGMKQSGWKRGSVYQIFERLRWLHAIRTQGSVYKLNNNYRPFYARLVMEREPELQGFFELRVQRSEYQGAL